MNRRLRLTLGCGMLLGWLAPAAIVAQSATPAPSAQPAPAQTALTGPRLWLTAGAASTTMRGDCQTCEELDAPYRHSGSIFGNIGYRVNNRMDAGGEIFWMPMNTTEGQVRLTHFDAVAQFRPWSSKGFFLKGGAGMAFVRNWVDATESDPIQSKALSVVIGGGWAFRPSERFGFQVLATQHMAALGDIQGPAGAIPDVIGNFWSLGAAVVIR